MENLTPTGKRYYNLYINHRVSDEGLQKALERGLITQSDYDIITSLNGDGDANNA